MRMARNSRNALNRLIAALEAHYEVVVENSNPDLEFDEEQLEAAEIQLCDAFFTYDDILFREYGVELPFEILDDYEDEDEEGEAGYLEADYDEDDVLDAGGRDRIILLDEEGEDDDEY